MTNSRQSAVDSPQSVGSRQSVDSPSKRDLFGVAASSAALLMIELALTRIFSVTMYCTFAFLAISIALFGLSASGVYVYLRRHTFERQPTWQPLRRHALYFAVATMVSIALLVRLRVGLNYSVQNLVLMLTIYGLAALPFFTGGAVISLAIWRFSRRINLVYGADLVGAATGCLILLPLMDLVGAPGVIVMAAGLGTLAAVLFAPRERMRSTVATGGLLVGVPLMVIAGGINWLAVSDTKGHQGDRVLFSKWNSFSRIAVYDRSHGDWSLSDRYRGPLPESRFMDIDSAASTPILRAEADKAEAPYLEYELTALGYHLRATGRIPDARVPPGFTSLVIGPGGGRDLLTALTFGAARVDGVEINQIIANDVMRDRFKEFSGSVYAHPRVRIFVEDGRSFVNRSEERYDLIQASLVDTWAATAAGAYTLTENTLYTVEAFGDYLDHLKEDGVLTITRWVFDGLRLVSLAQEACEARGWTIADRIAIVQQGRVATFLLKRTPFTDDERARLTQVAGDLGFTVLYVPGAVPPETVSPADPSDWNGPSPVAAPNDYARLILSSDRTAFYRQYHLDVRPTTDDRPFFFHTTRLENQAGVAFGRSMLFGNGLSALLSLMAISATLVALFVLGPLLLSGRSALAGSGWVGWLAYFGALGAGFMLIEMSLLQRCVLLLGHPVYSLAVTLFSLLLGTGLGSFVTRRIPDARLRHALMVALVAVIGLSFVAGFGLAGVVARAMSMPLFARILLATALVVPAGVVMGIPLPAGVRLLSLRRQDLVPWGWAMNGALSVVGATLAVFIAMNWGFTSTFATGAAVYGIALLIVARRG